MIRLVFSIIVLFLLAVGGAWLADRPGTLVLNWQGQEIRTSLIVAAVALIVVIAAIALLGAIIRAIVTSPRALGAWLGGRRRERGYRALSAGMIAIGSGDKRGANRAANEAKALLADEPLTLLLAAQAAQLSGDRDRARLAFEALAEDRRTRVLGLHGLFIEAKRQGEEDAARHFAEEAAAVAPHAAWAGNALFESQARGGDWLGAMRTLAANASGGLVSRDEARRLRASLLAARALQLEAGDPAEAQALALEAQRLNPNLVPGAVVASRLLTRAGEARRAARVLESAWKKAPHPEIAEAYAAVRTGDVASEKLKRMRRLAQLRPDSAEGALALARVAIDARDFAAARAALRVPAEVRPSERVCLLMAEIEEVEHGDQGRVRSWLTRALSAPRDPRWVADGQVFEHWAPVSPISGRVGVFEWKVVEPTPRRAVEIETARAVQLSANPAAPPADTTAALDLGGVRPVGPVSNLPIALRPAEPATDGAPPSNGRAASPAFQPGPARPPDDPGPVEEDEPAGSEPFRAL